MSSDQPSDDEGLGPRRLKLIAGVAVATLVLDQLTKWWALENLDDGPIELIGSLRLFLTYNTGMAFSVGSDANLGWLVSVVAIVVVAGLAWSSTSRIPLGAVATGLIAGGAVGNLADRAFRSSGRMPGSDDGFLSGAVVDFIDLQWWPVFNIADAGVVVGAILLVGASLKAPA